MPYLKQKYMQTIQQAIEKINSLVYTNVGTLDITCYKTPEPVSFQDRMTGEKVTLSIGDKWGELFDCGWFHFKGRVPACCHGKKTVLLIDVNGEGLVFDENGNPKRGLTCVKSQFCDDFGGPGKRVYIFAEEAKGNEDIELWMDAGCNDLFGEFKGDGTVREAFIATMDEGIRELFYDLYVLENLLETIDSKSAQYNQILFGMYEAVCKLKSFSREELLDLHSHVKKLYKKGGEGYLKFTAIGHAHIDLAWLWPIRETKRKGARTFSTVLDLMDRYPDYVFGASQPQLYEWMKENYPELYKRIKQKVKEGRWELQGCMWVEADTNLSGGEALVRQILYGKRFFMEEFGIEVRNLWLPDVFGYNGALPQILRKSGCDYFMTQKLSWSEHNKFPHQTFLWKGIDGTEIFAHMLPEENYNSPLTPKYIKFAEENYIDSGVCDEALMLFGIGDGGGGPGPEHLERAMRVKNLSGLCPVEQGRAEPMLARLEEKTRGRLQKWSGELYLEKHQGTYTTQAKNKYYNRKMEFALRELEFALVLSNKLDSYPKTELDHIWKEVLLYQFHDIIPGSSIKRVYDESLERYKILYERVNEMIDVCYSEIAGDSRVTVFNSLSWERSVIVDVNGESFMAEVPAMGYTTVLEPVCTTALKACCNTLENENLLARFDSDGALVSLFDKMADRETLSERSNLYAVYEDMNADCWDIAIEYIDRKPDYFRLQGQSFSVEGAFAVCQQTYAYNNSILNVKITLAPDGKKLDFNLTVDWQENLKMLRTSFVTDMVTDRASFEIQYGKLNRANNDNTLWQKAQFEVCGHKWVDLSEQDYGVALLNDCKYGYRVVEKTIDMNLLRSQNYPGVNADRGTHEINYALYPHTGNEQSGEVSRLAYEFNVPAIVKHGKGDCMDSRSAFRADGGIVVETVKKAEDSSDIILRAFEPYGSTVDARFKFDRSYRSIVLCDLMENELEVVGRGSKLGMRFKPFEIATFKLKT